jgi:hypothetical protein
VTTGLKSSALEVPFVIGGEIILGATEAFGEGAGRFLTPRIDPDRLVVPRSIQGPSYQVPIAHIIDFLQEVGVQLAADKHGYLAEARDAMERTTDLSTRILDACFERVPLAFERSGLELMIDREVGGPRVLDAWIDSPRSDGESARLRAFPPRAVHIMAGNAPYVAAISIVRGALSKGIHLFKTAANDLLTAAAILRTMSDIDPSHPVLRSMAAVYWRGGDAAIESLLYRPQYFDRLIVWGGESAVRNVMPYAGLGLELISFDPKVSLSIIGREAFESDAVLTSVVSRVADDVGLLNQDACSASRYVFVEGTLDQADRLSAKLSVALSEDRSMGDGIAQATPQYIRDEVDGLRALEPLYAVFGDFSGRGLVVRSDEPVEFHPEKKTVNVVRVNSLEEAVAQATVATQTVGIFPRTRRIELRDALASAGVQRVVDIGRANGGAPGLPHDGMFPLQRMMRWLVDEGI